VVYCTIDPCPELLGKPGGGWASVGGTSLAAPLLAGGVALADQRAATRRNRRLGPLNPLIYSLARGRSRSRIFRDVVKGNNDLGSYIPEAVGGGAPLGCCSAGPGYDLATGWGSVNVAAFSKAAARRR